MGGVDIVAGMGGVDIVAGMGGEDIVAGMGFLKREAARVVEAIIATGFFDHVTGTQHKTSNRHDKCPFKTVTCMSGGSMAESDRGLAFAVATFPEGLEIGCLLIDGTKIIKKN